jgi:hypothetical protein
LNGTILANGTANEPPAWGNAEPFGFARSSQEAPNDHDVVTKCHALIVRVQIRKCDEVLGLICCFDGALTLRSQPERHRLKETFLRERGKDGVNVTGCHSLAVRLEEPDHFIPVHAAPPMKTGAAAYASTLQIFGLTKAPRPAPAALLLPRDCENVHFAGARERPAPRRRFLRYPRCGELAVAPKDVSLAYERSRNRWDLRLLPGAGLRRKRRLVS